MVKAEQSRAGWFSCHDTKIQPWTPSSTSKYLKLAYNKYHSEQEHRALCVHARAIVTQTVYTELPSCRSDLDFSVKTLIFFTIFKENSDLDWSVSAVKWEKKHTTESSMSTMNAAEGMENKSQLASWRWVGFHHSVQLKILMQASQICWTCLPCL